MTFKQRFHNIKNIISEFSESHQRIRRIKKDNDFNLMKKVMISVDHSTFSNFIKLQTPEQLGVWNRSAFVSVVRPDIHLIINRPNPYLKLNKNISKNWTIHMEPPGYIQKLGMNSEKLLAQFGRVFTSDPDLYGRGGKFIASPPYVHWHLAANSYTKNNKGIQYDFDFLAAQNQPPVKEISLVAINSSINDLPGHKLRANFISKISENNLDYELYGTDNWSVYKQYKGRTVNGKWPIYSKAKYVLAIENEVADYYWTEKFTDAILCFCIPIYYGSPKIGNYFPEGSYIPLDITKKSAEDDLRDILSSDFYERNISKLIEARNLILAKHNLFNFIDEELQKKI